MKIVKATLLTLFLTSSAVNIHAQDPPPPPPPKLIEVVEQDKNQDIKYLSKDATWDETIEYITKHLPNFDHTTYVGYREEGVYQHAEEVHYYIENNTIFNAIKHLKRGYVSIQEANLEAIESADYSYSDFGINLRFKAKTVTKNVDGKSVFTYDLVTISLISKVYHPSIPSNQRKDRLYASAFSDKVKSMTKAFQHLVELAEEKRN